MRKESEDWRAIGEADFEGNLKADSNDGRMTSSRRRDGKASVLNRSRRPGGRDTRRLLGTPFLKVYPIH